MEEKKETKRTKENNKNEFLVTALVAVLFDRSYNFLFLKYNHSYYTYNYDYHFASAFHCHVS